MISLVLLRSSLNAGELSPSVWSRSDLKKNLEGLSTCRNFFVDYRGGIASRGGLAYVGTCRQPGTSNPPRDIPFQFNINQGYVLEFGDGWSGSSFATGGYLRIKFQGAYIIETAKNLFSVTSTAIFSTTAPHGYSVGDWVFIQGVPGFSGLTWIINTVPTGSEFTVTDLFGNVISSATPVSGVGTTSRIYTVSSPYASVDLPYLKYSQSADVMTLTCVNTVAQTEYLPYNLTRNGNTNWVFSPITFAATIQPPTNLTAIAQSSAPLSTYYTYCVTAVDSITGEESVASAPVLVQNNDIAQFAGSNIISWRAPSTGTPGSYNVYGSTPTFNIPSTGGIPFGLIGVSLGTSFTDTNIVPDFSQVPNQAANPFARGAVQQVVITPTAFTEAYDPFNSQISITSATGTGFIGYTVVTQSWQFNVSNQPVPQFQVSGIYIANPGQNYENTDTVSITSTGTNSTGGTAYGWVQFTGQPGAGNSIEINGANIEFLAASNITAPAFYQVQEGTTVLETVQNLAEFLNAYNAPAASANVQSATYGAVQQNASATPYLTILYKTQGSQGNGFTLAVGSSANTVLSGATLSGGGASDSSAIGTLKVGPDTGTFPGVCSYFQQRQIFGSSLNQPDTFWMSQPGQFNNFDNSIPLTSGDAITATPWAQQVNGVQFLLAMPGGLVALTGKGAWQVNGGQSAAVTPSDINAVPQAYNGCNAIAAPIIKDYHIVYVQAKGSIVRDLAYNFFVNIYTGTDLTILSNHLFNDFTLLQTAYCEEPYKLIWFLRNDGILLCLTYLPEQEVYSWSRHDTNGLFVSICSVTEPPVDALYTIVHRYVQGQWVYYSERINNRLWENIEDSFCVDAGISYPQTSPNATLTPAAATGTSVNFLASSSVFNSGMVGNVIRAGGGKATIITFNSGTSVIANIYEPITETIPNDPNNTPIPQAPNDWTISVPVTTVTNLNHLNGLTVAIVADGGVVSNQTVINNSITLPQPASNIIIGLPYTCQAQTIYLNEDIQGQNFLTKRKNISAIGLEVDRTRGLLVGADQIDASTQENFATVPWINLNEIKSPINTMTYGSGFPLFTGPLFKTIESNWRETGQIAIQQSYPLPAKITSTTAYMQIGDDK